jgi:predicted SprT family Zn-dependent metalloprotease
LQAPRKQVKKKSPGRDRERSELDLLQSYRSALFKLGTAVPALDLDNDFFWLFRLNGLMARGNRIFDEINHKHFNNSLSRPKIMFCNRSTGGYYNKTRHTIGISLAMTIEHGEEEFFETLLHEIAHIVVQSHSPRFYEVLTSIGGSGRKAPITILLKAKRNRFLTEHYRVRVRCPECKTEYRYRTRRALSYACRPCCEKFAGGKFDAKYKLETVL